MNNVIIKGSSGSTVDLPYAFPTPQTLTAPRRWYSTYDPVALKQASGKATGFLNMMRGGLNNLTQTTDANRLAVVSNVIGTTPGLQLVSTPGVCLVDTSANQPDLWTANQAFAMSMRFAYGDSGQNFQVVMGNRRFSGGTGYSFGTFQGKLHVCLLGLNPDGSSTSMDALGTYVMTPGQIYNAHASIDGSGNRSGISLWIGAEGSASDSDAVSGGHYSASLGSAVPSAPDCRFAIGLTNSNGGDPSTSVLLDAVVNGAAYISGERAMIDGIFNTTR